VSDVVTSPAAQVLVGGLLLPRPVAGHPALELCNTLAGWGDPAPRDYLTSYAALLALARHLDLLPAGETRGLRRDAAARPATAARTLGDVRRLRADLYAAVAHRDPAALTRLNPALARAAAARRITALGPHGPVWAAPDQGLRAPRTALAWAAYRLLDDPVAVSRVRVCPGDGCGWLFVDPRGQRRWCVMSLCGNRAKARRHAARA